MKRCLFYLFGLLFFCSSAFSQGGLKMVTGAVTDGQGVPIPGVNVLEKGTSNGVVTDFEGEFSIEVPDAATLVFSYLGYSTLEIPVAGENVLMVSMESEASALSEVVVVGYGTQRKADLTGAVSVVDVSAMNKQPAAQVTEQLQGRVSGVTIASSGQPGEAPQVRIRGINTFGDSNPLYVVDGVPVSDINALNPGDIATMQVLKDAGSASIYGARAANGVVIITTKKGQGELKVEYNGYYGTQRVPKGNVYDIASPQEQAELRWMAMQNTDPGEPITDAQYGNGAAPVLPYYILPGGAAEGSVDESTYYVDPHYTDPGAVAGFNQIMRANQQGTNWFQEIFSPAPITSHDLSISKGGENGSVLFSMGYFDQEGTLINTFYEKYTIRVNSDYHFSDNFRIGENLNVSLSDDNRVSVTGENPINHAYRMQPIIPVYDIRGNYAGTQAPALGNAYNGVALLDRNRNNLARTSRVMGNVYAEFDFLDGFTARSTFGGDYFNTNGHTFAYPMYENQENVTTNQLTKTALTGYNWTWSNTLQYKNMFGDVHDLTALIGTEAYYNQYEEVIASAQGFYSFDPDFVNLGSSSGTQNTNGFYTEDALFSVFARLDYIFDERYLLGATIRRDASSRFTNNRSDWFPSVSAGWRISQEDFMEDVIWISDLKLRGGYGVMGNQLNVDPANAFTAYGSSKMSSFYALDGSNSSITEGFYRNRIGNPDAGWEKNVNANFGIDAALFQNKLQLTADYYRKDVIDLLYNPERPGTSGVSTVPFVNIAEMKNSGFDFSATTFIDITPEFQMNASLTFTTYDNEIVNISEGGDYFDQEARRFNGSAIVRNAVGHSVGQFYGYEIVGFWNSQEEVDQANSSAQGILDDENAEYQQDIGVGRFQYRDVNGDGYVSDADRTFIGNPNPKFTGGLNIDLMYRNWDFNIFLYGSYGNDVWNQVSWWHDFYSSFGGAKSTTALYDSWTPTNQNASAPIQETEGNVSTTSVPNSYFVEDGSYLRAKNLQLGYTFPDTWLGDFGIDRLRLYVQATNLFTITNYSGVDPELTGGSTAFGIDEGAYPVPKQFLAGINLSL